MRRGVSVASRCGAMFQYQGIESSMPLRLSVLMDGGNQPDLRASESGKLSEGSARMGTLRKRSTAPSATPSLLSRSMLTRSVRSTQAGSAGVSRGQLVYSARVALERALS